MSGKTTIIVVKQYLSSCVAEDYRHEPLINSFILTESSNVMKSIVSEACSQHRGDEFLPCILSLSYLSRLRHDRRVNFLVYLEAKKGKHLKTSDCAVAEL